MNNSKKYDWKKKFLILWSGQGVSVFTSSVIQMAIVWYLTDTTGSAAILTMSTLVGYLPQVILGPIIGVWVDRHDRKLVMVCSDAFIAAISLSLVIAGSRGTVPVWLIMLVLCLRSIGAGFHNPSLQAVTPAIVPKKELTKYAGYSQGVESVSMLLSPAAAGILYSFLNLNQIILFDVGGAIFAIFTLSLIKIPDSRNLSGKKTGILSEAKEGLDVIRQEASLVALIFISTLYATIYFPIGSLFPLITMGYFNGSYLESGIVETAFSLGMLGGSLVLGMIGTRINKVAAITSSIGLYGAGLTITGLLPPSGLKIFVLLSFVMGISIPFYRGLKTAVIQCKIEEQYLGRVFSLVSSLQTMAIPFGLIFAGSLTGVIGVNNWFLLSGILTLIIAAVSKMMPSLRHYSD